jgi:hypothetical protein
MTDEHPAQAGMRIPVNRLIHQHHLQTVFGRRRKQAQAPGRIGLIFEAEEPVDEAVGYTRNAQTIQRIRLPELPSSTSAVRKLPSS